MALGYFFTESKTIYWGIEMGQNNIPPFWGSLKNPNHGGMLQLIGILLALGLAGRGFSRALLSRHFSGIQVFYLAIALFLSLATLQSLSRGPILLMAFLWFAALGVAGVMAYRERSFKMVGVMASFLVLLIAGGVVWYVTNTSTGQGNKNPVQKTLQTTVTQFDDFKEGESENIDRRVLLNRVSIRMFKTSPVYGYGIGSWSYFYRDHIDFLSEIDLLIANYSRFDAQGNRTKKGVRYATPMHFDHAHNEYMQVLCELGIVGTVVICLLILTLLSQLFSYIRAGGVGFIFLSAIGCVIVLMLYSMIEFPLRTPILGLFFAIFMASALLETQHRGLRSNSTG
tara:strand:- start:478 stop:1500 length:1023 start_codon:yes stop_codon:yes gene_type:complete